MEIIELETAIEIARKYIYYVSHGESTDDASVEVANEMREKKYDIEKEEEDWEYDEVTEEQLKLIRYMIYHDFGSLTKGNANRIIRILKQTDEDC